ncbi:FxsB family cyclophane-forming radical SAM/SPASM peptide maturase [Streptomyces sp. TP-A0356]|uniref:FxsB family cyclophane-forming radical SAM/SPASM peptide maturase n=1 Tax=Streptomyces sp. TP-A0356 TaxID=1359208 RepID=UPI00099EA506|nr:FxsB family cyclophane-forming radical SAM/SPASM peptide maturase [Streptomyces sp. TP-A0356]
MRTNTPAGRRAPDHPAVDVAALLDEGWRPVPLRQFVLKIRSRCNLACDYCIIYEHADQTWRRQPHAMAPGTLRQTARRIAEHAARHGLQRVRIVLHGGEPLLAGPEGVAHLARTVRDIVGEAGAEADFTVQTNGTLLSGRMLDVLAEHRIRVGVSLDGDRDAHDAHRRTAAGRGSYDRVMAGLRRLSGEHPDLYAGLLCTIDAASDPVAVYESLLPTRPPVIDFLLPHAHWGAPPQGPPGAYGRWLAAVFDRWAQAPRKETSVRMLDELLHTLLGGRSRLDWVGITRTVSVFVEADGAIHQNDTLRTGHDGASASGLDVFRNSFDDVLLHPGFAARQAGERALAGACLRCPELSVCGGGEFGHRYRPGAGYRWPTVYCTDLLLLIRHMRGRLPRPVEQTR